MSMHESTGITDEWYTPKYIFDAMEVKFDTDVCSPQNLTHVSTPCNSYIHCNSLEKEWNGFVWCNPPFGGRNGIIPWLNKLAEHGNGIALTPDRTSTDWWQDIALKADGHLQVRSKIKFIGSDGTVGKQPSNGTTLFAFGDMAIQALKNAQKNKLGILFKNN